MLRYLNDIPGTPSAVGPYSKVVVAGNLAFLSGQIALDPKTGKLIDGDVEAQAEQVMHNINVILTHLGIGFTHVAKSTIFLTDMATFQKVNEVYARFVGETKPARSTVQVSALPLGAKVEVEVIAVLG